MRRLARRLPGNLLAAVEIRLGVEAGPIDLALRVQDPAEALGLAPLLPAWAAPVHSVWLEFDLDCEPGDVLRPIVCAKLFRDADLHWLTGTLFPSLHGKPLTSGQRRLIQLCHETIPAPAYLLYAFSLLPRGLDALRLEIFGLDPAGILAYLERVAPEAVPWVQDEAALFEGVERIHLSLDLGEEILPRIGIEGSFARLPRREPRWSELFERLVGRGLCRPEKRDAALAWAGSERFQAGFCYHKLSHVKVICRPDRKLETKAYLLFGYLPERPRS
ncbi:MAG TPA: hypothetical protein VN493_04830 [Thermoanaerobaculia bacterium]|nr:hypothetical protein [Thermoanaerobaculia bacterium]